MKKIFLITAIAILCASPVMAKNVKVEAMSDFSTANPPQTWKLKVVEPFMSKDNFMVQNGCIIEGKIVDVTDPKRLKRNAAFTFVPIRFYDEKGNVYNIDKDLVGKYSPLSDITAGGVAKEGALFVGDKIAKGFLGPGIAIVDGAVKNERGNRAVSSAVSLYESTPLSYCNKGHEVEIPKGKVFIMSFKDLEEEPAVQAPNYSYTPIEN